MWGMSSDKKEVQLQFNDEEFMGFTVQRAPE
jgi:hypothetical protein